MIDVPLAELLLAIVVCAVTVLTYRHMLRVVERLERRVETLEHYIVTANFTKLMKREHQ